MTLAPGTTVGPYAVVRLLGRGGMAVVYEAVRASSGRTVALKLVLPEHADSGFVERLRQEGRMQAALDHPHVVTVYEAGDSEHGPWLAMQLVRGTTLVELIRDGSLTADRTLALLDQVAGGLDAAHAAGLVHRDVKPRNILVDDAGAAYLADFGLTRSRETDAEEMTASGHFMGTIAYAAPEVVAGEEPGPAADRYALAAVLFECLTGNTVFPRPTHAAVLYAHANEPPPRVSGRREGIPAALDAALIAGLDKDPRRRPARAGDLLASARKALRGVELGPPPHRGPPALDDETTDDHLHQGNRLAGSPKSRDSDLGARGVGWRRVAIAAGLAGVLIGGVAGALLSGGDDPAPGAAADVLPPAPEGSEALGASLAVAGDTRGCDGKPVEPTAGPCTVFQDSAPDATLIVQRNGVVRRWGVRSARGELALTVLRRRDDGYFQIARSRNEFVGDDRAHVFDTELVVERGDRLGLVVIGGSGVGVRATGGAIARFDPMLAGFPSRPAQPGPSGELLLRVDYVPGDQRRVPGGLRGPAAAAAPEGKVLARKSARYAGGTPFEVRLVEVEGRGAVDLFHAGSRVARVPLEDLNGPIEPDVTLVVGAYDEPQRVGIDVAYRRLASERVVRHYLDGVGGRLILIN